MPTKSKHFTRVALCAAAVASMATSQVESGERGTTGQCPADELCSELTPEGLYFSGMATGDVHPLLSRWPQATALGGTQSIGVFEDAEGESPFGASFEAISTNSALEIVRVTDNQIALQGAAIGSAKLRIVDPATSLLFDRVELQVAQAVSMALVPAGHYQWGDLVLRDEGAAFAILSGRDTRLTVQLLGTQGIRLVDAGMELFLGSGFAADQQGLVDTVVASPESAGIMEFTASAGGIEETLQVQVVDNAERIEQARGSNRIVVGKAGQQTLCFEPWFGDALVVGASFTYIAEEGILLSQAQDDIAEGCVSIEGSALGTYRLEVQAAGHSASFDLMVRSQALDTAEDVDSLPSYQPARVEKMLSGERATRSK